jgi:hypothetical protein
MEYVIKDIPGFFGYKVDNMGVVWSFKRGYKERLTPRVRPEDGYLTVTLTKNGKSYTKRVHRLVLEAFCGPCPEGMETRHTPNSDRANNRLDNLQWGTHSDNIRDSLIRICSTGKKNKNSKISPFDVRNIIDMIDDGIKVKEIADDYGVSASQIYKVKSEKSWGWLPEKMEEENYLQLEVA